MAKPPFSFLQSLDEAVHPFHRGSLGLVFCSTLSLQAVATSFLEPVSNVWFSFLLTFPLTTGLTIVFLILANLKWRRLSLAWIVSSLALFAVLFMALTMLSKALGLPAKAARYELNHEKKESQASNADSANRSKVEQKAGDSLFGNHLTHVLRNPEKPAPYLGDNGIFRYLPSSAYVLIDEFRGFYKLYGPSRFWSGIFLAGFFTYYIRRMFGKLKEKLENS